MENKAPQSYNLTITILGKMFLAKLTDSSILFWHPKGKRTGGPFNFFYKEGQAKYRLEDLLLCASGAPGSPRKLSSEALGDLTSPRIRAAVREAEERIEAKKINLSNGRSLTAQLMDAERALLLAARRGEPLDEVYGKDYRLAYEAVVAAEGKVL
jgi:hypothetical protein